MLFWKKMHIFVANLLKCNFCKHLIIAEFISIAKVPETLHARFPVWSSLYRYYSIATCKNKPLVSRVHFQGICHNRFLYLLERSSEALVTLFWATSSIKSEEISANGMPCPGGMSVGIRSSFC